MLSPFQIREGGAGNVVSHKWQGDGLAPFVVTERNPRVSSKATEYWSKYLALFKSFDTFEADRAALEARFTAAGVAIDPALAEALDRAAENVRQGKTVAIVAHTFMLPRTLIHYEGDPPTIGNGTTEYMYESHKILKSNGGAIRANEANGGTMCVFYHPFSWLYADLILDGSIFSAVWEYAGAVAGFTQGKARTRLAPDASRYPYPNNTWVLSGFATFSDGDGNTYRGLPSSYFRNQGLEQAKGPNGWYAFDLTPPDDFGALSPTSYTPHATPTRPIIFIVDDSSVLYNYQQTQAPYDAPENPLKQGSATFFAGFSDPIAAFWWEPSPYTFPVKSPFLEERYGTIAETISALENELASSAYYLNQLLDGTSLRTVGEYTNAEGKLAGFVASSNIQEAVLSEGRISSFKTTSGSSTLPHGHLSDFLQNTTTAFVCRGPGYGEQPISVVTPSSYDAYLQLLATIEKAAFQITANVSCEGKISQYWDIYPASEKVAAMENASPLQLHIEIDPTYASVPDANELYFYGSDPSSLITANVVDGLVTIPIRDLLAAYGITLSEDTVEQAADLFRSGPLPLHFLVNESRATHAPIALVLSFAVASTLQTVANSWEGQ